MAQKSNFSSNGKECFFKHCCVLFSDGLQSPISQEVRIIHRDDSGFKIIWGAIVSTVDSRFGVKHYCCLWQHGVVFWLWTLTLPSAEKLQPFFQLVCELHIASHHE